MHFGDASVGRLHVAGGVFVVLGHFGRSKAVHFALVTGEGFVVLGKDACFDFVLGTTFISTTVCRVELDGERNGPALVVKAVH